MGRRAQYYYYMNVYDYLERGCLNYETLLKRKAALDHDYVYFKLAQEYWRSQGEVYNLEHDGL